MRNSIFLTLLCTFYLYLNNCGAQSYCHDFLNKDFPIYTGINFSHRYYERNGNIRKGISLEEELRFNFFTVFRKKYDGKFMIKDAVDAGFGVGALDDPSGSQKGYVIIPLFARYGFSFIKRRKEKQYMSFRIQCAGEYLEHFTEDKTVEGYLLNTSRMLYAFSYSWPRVLLEANVASPSWFRGDPDWYFSNSGFGFRFEVTVADYTFLTVGFNKVFIRLKDSKYNLAYNNYKPHMDIFNVGFGLK